MVNIASLIGIISELDPLSHRLDIPQASDSFDNQRTSESKKAATIGPFTYLAAEDIAQRDEPLSRPLDACLCRQGKMRNRER